MPPRPNYPQAVLIAVALAFLLAITPNRGTFPSTADIIAVQNARASGADLTEWQLLARFLSQQPQNAALWERMAILDHRNGYCEQSVFEFMQVEKNSRLASDSFIPYAECLMELGRFQDTVELLSPHTGTDTAPAGTHILLAKAWLRLGRHDQAFQVVSHWVDQKNTDPHAIYAYGLYLALIDPAEALSILQKAITLSPEMEMNYRVMQSAINLAQLSDDPAYQALEIGRAYGSLGEWELAQYAFSSAVALNPEYAEAHAWLGEAQQHLGEDGTEEFNHALSLNPDSVLARALSALALMHQGNPQAALTHLERIAELEPANPQWLISIGEAHTLLGQTDLALLDYQKATRLQPQNAAAWQALAEFSLAYQIEVQSVGIPAASKAVLLSPDDPRSLDLAAQAAMTSADLTSAEDYLRKAINLNPRYAEAHLHLALVLFQRSENAKAVQELIKAASLGNLEADNLLQQLHVR
ncbi:MAG: tetratricopeptide repeat protein [Anaerolineaceae bacterium]|nr:tetratricopeptide repeat protein [Anaerolineaceae bacterium]